MHPAIRSPTACCPNFESFARCTPAARVRPSAVKLFADGVIEARTAALLSPYLDPKGDAGKPIYDPSGLKDLAVALDRDGFQIHVHAIGDRAIRETLDAFAYARARNGAHDARHSITHLELIDPVGYPPVSGPWRGRQLPALLGQRRRVSDQAHRAGAGPGAIPLALSHRERRPHRGRGLRRE